MLFFGYHHMNMFVHCSMLRRMPDICDLSAVLQSRASIHILIATQSRRAYLYFGQSMFCFSGDLHSVSLRVD